jgi:hypothetical protein
MFVNHHSGSIFYLESRGNRRTIIFAHLLSVGFERRVCLRDQFGPTPVLKGCCILQLIDWSDIADSSSIAASPSILNENTTKQHLLRFLLQHVRVQQPLSRIPWM